jgi:hypothetical protein
MGAARRHPAIRWRTAVIPAAAVAPVKIRRSHLTKRFRTKAGVFTAVDDVSVEIGAGSFFMIVGDAQQFLLQQRLGLLVERSPAANDPEILLMDEPFSAHPRSPWRRSASSFRWR